jgi:carboxymethylenebutenolidase
MDTTLAPELKVMLPRSVWSRRGFVMTSLATGFALSAQPISAQTAISTDTNGLTAGEVKVPTAVERCRPTARCRTRAARSRPCW